jgi:hypothetical protein
MRLRSTERWAIAGIGLMVVAALGLVTFAGSLRGSMSTFEQEQEPVAEFEAVYEEFGSRPPLLSEPTSPPHEFDAAVAATESPKLSRFFNSLEVLGWEPANHRIRRISLPGHIVFWNGGGGIGLTGILHLKVRAQDFRRLPTGVLLDHRAEDGTRVIVWIR